MTTFLLADHSVATAIMLAELRGRQLHLGHIHPENPSKDSAGLWKVLELLSTVPNRTLTRINWTESCFSRVHQ